MGEVKMPEIQVSYTVGNLPEEYTADEALEIVRQLFAAAAPSITVRRNVVDKNHMVEDEAANSEVDA